MTTSLKDQPDDYWKEKLSPEQYQVTRQKETEPAFSGEYIDNHKDGIYRCVACGEELFASDTKFDSRSGWPSFTDPITKGNIELHRDETYGMIRTEITCAHCGSHLGHVFEDGPNDKGGMRYCVNSLSLQFEEKTKQHED